MAFFKNRTLNDEEKSKKLTKREILQKGTIICIILIVPSLVTFLIVWQVFDDLTYAMILGAMIHFIAMIFSKKYAPPLE